MGYIFPFLILISFVSCQNSDKTKSDQNPTKEINLSLASLYPLQDKWLELQNLQWVEQASDSRNFKNSSDFHSLKNEVYATFCNKDACYTIDESLQFTEIPQDADNTRKIDGIADNFLFPTQDGWVVATSLPNENLFNIRKLNIQLEEQWQIIFEKNRTDSTGQLVHYAQILGYNDDLLIFNSKTKDIRKSGYIQLNNGIKKQAEAQWSSLIIDEDERTVLGQLVQNEDLSFELQLGSKSIPLPSSISGFDQSRVVVSKNQIFISFFFTNNDIVKVFAIDYHTGNILWDNSIMSAKSITNVQLSTFEEKLLIEIISTQQSGLHVLQKTDGKLLDKF